MARREQQDDYAGADDSSIYGWGGRDDDDKTRHLQMNTFLKPKEKILIHEIHHLLILEKDMEMSQIQQQTKRKEMSQMQQQMKQKEIS